MRDLIVLFVFRERSRKRVMEWVRDEWVKYADRKKENVWSNLKNDSEMRSGGLSQDGYWCRQILQYWGRAEALGLETEAGRQVAMKSLTTMIDAMASMSRVHGEPPLPGYPSGEIHRLGDGCPSHV